MVKLIDTDKSVGITGGKGEWGLQKKVKGWGSMVMEDLTWGSEHTIQYTDDY